MCKSNDYFGYSLEFVREMYGADVRLFHLVGASSPVVEPPSQSQHQVVGVVEVLQLIAGMQVEVAGERRLEGEHLIPSFRVFSLVKEVVSHAEVDGEDGHHELKACRHSCIELLLEGRAVEFRVAVFVRACQVFAQVGAFVVLGIEREAGAKHAVEVVHRVEVDARHAERTGHQRAAAVLVHPAAYLGGAVEREVVADVRAERQSAGRQGGFCLGKGRAVAEAAGDAYPCPEGVDACVGVVGVAVGEVGALYAGGEVPAGRQAPVQEEAQVDVGVDAGAVHHVVRVEFLVVLLPAEGGAEVPLVVQGQAGCKAGDAGALEGVERYGRTCFRVVEEGVDRESDALRGMRIEPSEARVGVELDAVLQVGGEEGVHAPPLVVASLVEAVAAPEEAAGGGEVGGAHVGGETVDGVAEGGYRGVC